MTGYSDLVRVEALWKAAEEWQRELDEIRAKHRNKKSKTCDNSTTQADVNRSVQPSPLKTPSSVR